MENINIKQAEAYTNKCGDYMFYGQLNSGNYFMTGEEWEAVMIFDTDIRISTKGHHLIEETSHFYQNDWIRAIIANIIREGGIDESLRTDLVEIIAREIDPSNYELATNDGTYALFELMTPVAEDTNARRTTSDAVMLIKDTGNDIEVIDYIYGVSMMSHFELCDYMISELINQNRI